MEGALTDCWISRQRRCCWAVVGWIDLNPFPFLITHPRLFIFSFSLFLCLVGFMLLVCILSYLKHFINPCKGDFLHKEFQVFYVFFMYLIVTNWKNTTPPYVFFPSLCILAERTVPNPRHGRFGLNRGDLREGGWCPHRCPAPPLQGRDFWRRQSNEVQVFPGGAASSLVPIFQLY